MTTVHPLGNPTTIALRDVRTAIRVEAAQALGGTFGAVGAAMADQVVQVVQGVAMADQVVHRQKEALHPEVVVRLLVEEEEAGDRLPIAAAAAAHFTPPKAGKKKRTKGARSRSPCSLPQLRLWLWLWQL